MEKLMGVAGPALRRCCCRQAGSWSREKSWLRLASVSQPRRFNTSVRRAAGQAAAVSADAGHDAVDAVVVGGGPGGIAVVGNLLDKLAGKQRQVWVDPSFRSGRVGARYREVPSNTKAALFLQFATCLSPFQHIVDSAPAPNAATTLRELPQDQGCTLGYAADLCVMLTDGVAQHFSNEVQMHHGRVTTAVLEKHSNVWTVAMDSGKPVKSPRLVLCTGSNPISAPLPILSEMSNMLQPGMTTLDLDIALKPSVLAETLDPSTHATIAVIGASHSAILVLMNLYNLAATTHPHLRVKWFTRHKELRYAKYMEDWILYDNTGLKGEAAQWARENLEEETFAASPVSKVITKLWTPVGEGRDDAVYHAELPACTHIVQAVGYQREPLPELFIVEQPGAQARPLTVEHDSISGRFFEKTQSATPESDRRYLPGLFGAGIAFPERVTDPAGNVELSVGFWKFMKFLRRVVPEWVAKP